MKFRFCIVSLFICLSQSVLAWDCGKAELQIGWFSAWQGKSQHIDIEGLIGDDFSVKKHSDQNLLLGAGYFFNGFESCRTKVLWGINAFYLAQP